MDPLMDPPATTDPPAAEPPGHLAHVAFPSPPPASNNSHNHPPYAEMIAAAITALKEKNGSSRQAIAKYIEKEYSDLPSSHSALLTHHLKRLKNSGQLVMVKHSYMLPRSVPLSSSTGFGFASASTANGNANASSSGPKRGPGRPPKPKAVAQINEGLGPEAMLVSLGLVDGPAPVAKRGPGRPPKAKNGALVTESGGIGPEPIVVPLPESIPEPVSYPAFVPGLAASKRGPGRPPRPKPLSLLVGQNGPKRGRGRPPRNGTSRPRGRPKKVGSIAQVTAGRPRGRPPRNAMAVSGGDAGATIGTGGAVLPAKRRGRPPKTGMAKKPRRLSGKPLGRPKKDATAVAMQVAATQHLMAYQDLRIKLEHFQSRIKQAVSVVKPQLNNESAFAAMQELEELAVMDVNAPLHVQEPLHVQAPPLVQN